MNAIQSNRLSGTLDAVDIKAKSQMRKEEDTSVRRLSATVGLSVLARTVASDALPTLPVPLFMVEIFDRRAALTQITCTSGSLQMAQRDVSAARLYR